MFKMIIISILFTFTILAKEPSHEVIFKTDNVIWGFDFINENEVLLTEKSGSVWHFDLKSKKKTKMQTPKYDVKGQGGLLDILIHKEKVYITFVEKRSNGYTTSLGSFDYKDLKFKNFKKLYSAKIKSDTGRHFGSRILINENKIFLTIGDRGERDFAQNLKFDQGKILRLNLDGSVPKDNPFKNAIWSYGHRNPQGIDINPVTNKIFSCEFGPRGGDELNLIERGKNYGWPIITYGKEYWGPKIGGEKKKGMEQPITYWTPSISPSGMVFYRGEKIKKWKNHLFLGNLGSTHLRRIVLKDNKVKEQEVLFKNLGERIRQVKNGLDGYLYFSTDSGKIIRVGN